MRKAFVIKCKVPIEFHVEATSAEEAINTIRSSLNAGKRLSDSLSAL